MKKRILSSLLTLCMAITVMPNISAYDSTVDEYDVEQVFAETRDQFIISHGGTLDQVNIMVDGQYLTFPEGAEPYIEDGVTYVDTATLSSAVGMQIFSKYGNYVPIRTISEKLGYDVYYDEYYDSVVLLDTEDIASRLDREFRIVNELLQTGMSDFSKNYESNTSMQSNITLYDSVDGDKTYTADLTYNTILSSAGTQNIISYDISEFISMITEIIDIEELSSMSSIEIAYLENMLNGEVEIRWNFEEDMMYIYMPLLSQIAMLTGYEDDSIDGWYAVEMDSSLTTELMQSDAITYGNIMCTLTPLLTYNSPVYYYDEITDTSVSASIFGDDKFEQKGSLKILSIDIADIAANLSDSELDDIAAFEINLTIESDGDYYGNFILETNSNSLDNLAIALEIDFDCSPDSSETYMTFDIEDIVNVELDVLTDVETTTKSPNITLPE